MNIGYAARKEWVKGQHKSVCVLMHRQIMESPEGIQVDHKDRNRLNNQRSNLRNATIREQRRNRGVGTSNTTGYKGVYFCKQKDKFQAYIRPKYGKVVHIGFYVNKEDAAKAYDRMAKFYFKEFAYLNFP